MKKTITGLILAVMVLMVMSAAGPREKSKAPILDHAVVRMLADESCTPFICTGRPLWVNVSKWLNADESTISIAAVVAVASPVKSIDRDGRRLHRVNLYAHILWAPGMDGGMATAATQRTRAVQAMRT